MESVQSAYIHIPFCKQMCHYCNFVKYVYQETRATEYVEALGKEMDCYLPEDNNRLKTIYIGGGTPTALNREQLTLLMETIHNKFDVTTLEEFTIEMNPGDVDEEKIGILKAYGVNRISFGVQVMDDKMLERLGRIHRVKDVYDTVDFLMKHQFNNISLDLIYALPHQSVEQFTTSLKEALAFNLPHYSSYALQIEPRTVFYQLHRKGKLHRPQEEEEITMYGILKKEMEKNGLEQYEISNFAKPGYESKHNLTYWNNDHYYGFGAGASGYLPGERFMNVRPLGTYIRQTMNGIKPILEIDPIGLKEQIEEELILGFRKTKGYDAEQFKTKFGISLQSLFGDSLRKLVEQGLVTQVGSIWKLTDDGMVLANRVFKHFILDDHQLENLAHQHTLSHEQCKAHMIDKS